MREETNTGKPPKRRSRIVGVVLLAGGCLMAANAVFSGPHAFATGWTAVIGQVVVGVVCVIAGIYELVRRKAGM